MAEDRIEECDVSIEITEEEVEEWFDSEEEVSDREATEDEVVRQYTEAQLRIVRSSMDLSLHMLRQALDDPNYINMNPQYQRRQRWNMKQRSQLIESLLLNIPVPPVFLFENDYNQYEIMDGRQRLDTIKGFLENSFALRRLEYWPELNGRRFKDLPQTIQNGLLRRTVSAIVLLAETSKLSESDIDVRMALFKRLNTGGISLNAQELRNALYPSRFNELLLDLSRWDVFRNTWRMPVYVEGEDENPSRRLANNALYKTMADSELVLRFFAIKETVQWGLSGSLRQLMDMSMRRHMGDEPGTLEELRAEYCFCLEALYEVFEGAPFVLPGSVRPGRPAYDAFMVAAALVGPHHLPESAEQIRCSLAAAVGNESLYEVLVGRGNTVEAINERVALAQQILIGEVRA